jgi:hypothetical protein
MRKRDLADDEARDLLLKIAENEAYQIQENEKLSLDCLLKNDLIEKIIVEDYKYFSEQEKYKNCHHFYAFTLDGCRVLEAIRDDENWWLIKTLYKLNNIYKGEI